MNEYDKTRYKVIRALIGDVSKKVIVDMGAGINPLSKGLNSKETILIDGVQDHNPDIVWDFNEGKIPLKNRSVDLIIAGEIIEHLLNPVLFLRECNRILREEGEIILSTPNICSLKNRMRILFNKIPQNAAMPVNYPYEERYSIQNHIADFNFKVLEDLLKKARFKLEDKKTNGIFIKNRLVFPLSITPSQLGEIIIIRAIK